MADQSPDTHLLRQLALPARYEALVDRVGPEVAQLLVDPGEQTKQTLQRAALAIKSRHEGALLPLVGGSGTGKTTLARNLVTFLPTEYTATVIHDGDVDFDSLRAAVAAAGLAANDERVIPINIDHREANPPSAQELAETKRFIRDPEYGSRSAILWPQTSTEQAEAMAEAYVEVTGRAPVDLPIRVEGPSRDTWQQVALSTLTLSNQMIESLELLGVDPHDYDPEAFKTLGEFLRRIADDFTEFLHKLIAETELPVKLAILFASESPDPGVLSQLTSSARYGFLDASALLDATPNSQIGKWWADRRGTLTQTIVRLDAHAICLAPTASVPILRRYGSDVLKEQLDGVIEMLGPAALTQNLRRSDLGHVLLGTRRSTFEARGTPSTQATPAFQLIAETGFTLGNDKSYNRALAEGVEAFLSAEEVEYSSVKAEQNLPPTALIPDVAVRLGDQVLTLEPTWRKGAFLLPANRSTAAQYILTKLRNYALALGWIS
jgi:energy-coupling factor transporter ATP-binding protein EcfA2